MEASCGRATRDDWNTVGDPTVGSSEVNEEAPIARHSLRRAASLDSVTRGGLKSEITEWTRWSAGDARSADNTKYPTFSHDPR